MGQLLIGGPNRHITNGIGDGNGHANAVSRDRVDTHGIAVSGIAPVSGADNTAESRIGLGGGRTQQDELAMSLNLALAPEQLSKSPTNTVTHQNANTVSAVNTAANFNNTSAIPSPVINRSSNSIDGSNRSNNKSTGLSGLRTSIHSMASSASSPVVSNDVGSNTMRMFQRMDEMSARLIAMEEMFHKLCKTIDQQSVTIEELKGLNSQLANDLSHKIDHLSQAKEQSKDAADQDSFVTDLLNSITNVSSTYLRKIRSRTDVNKKTSSAEAMNESNQHFLPEYHHGQHYTGNNSNTDSKSNSLHAFEGKRPSNATFTLNPDGIKRRKKHEFMAVDGNSNQAENHNTNGHSTHALNSSQNSGFNSNIPSGAQSYTDLNSINAFGTMSLPNLTLENTGITPLLKYGVNGMHFPKVNENSNSVNNHTSSHEITDNNIPQQQNRLQQMDGVHNKEQQHPQLDKLPKPVNFSVGLDPVRTGTEASINHAGIGNDVVLDEDDDEAGYQEDDDDDNEEEDDGEDDDDDDENEEDEDDEDGDQDTPHEKKSQNKTPKKRKHNRDFGKSSHIDHRLAITDDKNIKAATPKNGKAILLKLDTETEGRSSVINKHRDINYTLLKAPSNVRTIWEEYSVGIDGNPSIKGLEEKYGNKWRLNRNRKTFARRKRLYKFILNGTSKGKSADEMIDILEERRFYKDDNGEVKRRTIGWLQQSLTGI